MDNVVIVDGISLPLHDKQTYQTTIPSLTG
jgi:hypothetical protein